MTQAALQVEHVSKKFRRGELHNHGNYEGEAASNPGTGSTLGDYPEILVADRNFPEGRFDDFQRHKLRLWTIYSLEMGRFGAVDIAPVWRYNSALTYSLIANSVPLSAIQRAANPGYARLPGSGEQPSRALRLVGMHRRRGIAHGQSKSPRRSAWYSLELLYRRRSWLARLASAARSPSLRSIRSASHSDAGVGSGRSLW